MDPSQSIHIVQAIVIPLWLSITIMVLMMVAKIAMALLMRPRGGGPNANDAGTRVTNRDSIAPRQVAYGRTRLFGTIVFLNTSGEKNAHLDIVVVFATHQCDAIEKTFFNDDEVQWDSGDPRFAIGKYLHEGNRHVFHEEKLGVVGESVFPDLINNAVGWTEAHRLEGCCAVRYKLEWHVDVFPTGMPNISILARGKPVYNPVLDAVAWSENPALCVNDYLTDDMYGRGEDYATAINEDDLIAAQSACDETFMNPEGVLEKRYTCNGSFKTDKQPIDILNSMLTSMAGHVCYVGGVWKIMAGVWTPSTFALTADDFRGPIKVPVVTSAKDSFNSVRGTFISKAENYVPTSFPAVIGDEYADEDGEVVYTDIDLQFTTSPYVAQRIARVFLRRIRQEIAFEGRVALRMWQNIPGDNGTVTYPIFGWNGKLFEIAEMSLVLGSDGGEGGDISAYEVDLSLRETTDFIFDVRAGDDILYDPAPNTDLPDIFNVSPPDSLLVSEEVYITRDGSGVKAKVVLSWQPSQDAFVTSGGKYLVEYSLSGQDQWTEVTRTEQTTVEILDIPVPFTYDFRVTAINSRGVSSASLLRTQLIVGLSDPPTEPQNMTISPIGGLAYIEWDPPTEIDVIMGGLISVRHSPLLVGATWASGTSIGRSVNGTQHGVALPLKPGTYMAKTQDAGGVWSTNYASATTDQSGLLTFNTLATVTEDPTFAGAKTNCSVLSGQLKMTGPGLFSLVPLVSAMIDFAFIQNKVNTTASYAFTAKTDLGAVHKVRLTGLVSSLVYNEIDKMSTWPSVGNRTRFGGSVTGNEADARLWMRKTQDDPNAAPTWTAWCRLDSAEHSARGFDFRLDMSSVDSNFNIQFDHLGVAIEEAV